MRTVDLFADVFVQLVEQVRRDNPHFVGDVRIWEQWNPQEEDSKYARSCLGVTVGCTGNHHLADYAWSHTYGWVLWAN